MFTELYRAVLGGVRPPIPEDTNKRLAALISACWNGDPAVRPSFQKVVDELDTVIMELAVPLHGAREWWLSSFKMAQRVQWFTFINKYCHDFKIVAEFIKVEDVLISRAEDCMAVSVDIRAFEALITDKTTGEVAAEKFGDAVSWLGELPAYGRRIMRIASKMLRKEYFFGDVSKEESEKLLSQKPPGTFLVRFSTSNLGGYTISRVTHTGAISHRRITHYAGALEYSFGNEKANSLPDIIEKIRPQQHLDSPCPGWPFAYLFAAPSATNGYTDNDGYDDGNDDDMENE